MSKIVLIDHVGVKGGMDGYDIPLLSALKAKGHEVELFSNFSDESVEFHVWNIFSKKAINIFNYFNLSYQYQKIIKKCSMNKTDWIFLHVFHAGKFEKNVLRKMKTAKLKVAIILHDIESFVHVSSESSVPEILELADLIFVHNKFMSEELSAKYPDSSVKTKIIPHGNIDLHLKSKTDSQKKLGLNPANKYVLFFGMIKKNKGLEVLINSMKYLPENIHLVIAGRLRKHSYKIYQQLIESLKLSNRVHSEVKYISNEKRLDYFSACDVIILPYTKIYQSGILIQAMTSGVPVIISDLVPNLEIIRDNWNGLLFPSGNETVLAEKIRLLLDNPAMKDELISNAKKTMEDEHNWKSIVDKINASLA